MEQETVNTEIKEAEFMELDAETRANDEPASSKLEAALEESISLKDLSQEAIEHLAEGLSGAAETEAQTLAHLTDLVLLSLEELRQNKSKQEEQFVKLEQSIKQLIPPVRNENAKDEKEKGEELETEHNTTANNTVETALSGQLNFSPGSLNALEEKLDELQEGVENISSILSALKERPQERSATGNNEDKYTQLEQQLISTLDQGTLGLSRRQLELDNKLSRIDAQLTSLIRNNTPNKSIAPWLLSLLLLANGFMMIWIKYGDAFEFLLP